MFRFSKFQIVTEHHRIQNINNGWYNAVLSECVRFTVVLTSLLLRAISTRSRKTINTIQIQLYVVYIICVKCFIQSNMHVSYLWLTCINLFSDVDECSRVPQPCAHVCHNTEGSFFCSCQVGYRINQLDYKQCNGRLSWNRHTCLFQTSP